MMDLPWPTLGALLAWGTVVGVDLVSVPQGMIARPFVAGAVAGAILGDPAAGVRIGIALELFALDVLPVGAVRYPEYGPATVAAVAVGVFAPWELALGLSVMLGLVLALFGGWSMQSVRRANARSVRTHSARLMAGDYATVRRIHFQGLARDLVRAVVVTAVGLALALAVRRVPLARPEAVGLTLVAVGAGCAAAFGGAWRGAGHGSRLRWLAAGMAAGLAWVLLG